MTKRFLALLLLAGCTPGNTVPPSTQPLVVVAPASLRGEFDGIAAAFKAHHPDVAISVITATPQQVAEQGLPVDVVATDSGAAMQPLEAKLHRGERRDFGANVLCLVARAGAGEARLETLATTPWVRKVALGDSRSDATAAQAEAAMGRLGIRRAIDSRLLYVGTGDEALKRVARGEADVGFALASEVAAWNAKAETKLQILDRYSDERTRFTIGILANTQRMPAAKALVDEVLKGEGPKLFAAKGYTLPEKL
jgi:molybdate transport system substrate-binding protein